MRALIVAIVMSAAPASAGEHDAAFARELAVQPSRVKDLAGYELPAGGDYTHVLVGRHDTGKSTMAAAVILRCAATTCEARLADFGAADEIVLAGVIDLEGEPAAIPAARIAPASDGYAKLAGRRHKWPALVVRTTENREAGGKRETRTRLYLISLAADDRANVVLQDTAVERLPSGSSTRTYRLERAETGKQLDIIATVRDTRCAKPGEQKFVLDGRHFKAVGQPEAC